MDTKPNETGVQGKEIGLAEVADDRGSIDIRPQRFPITLEQSGARLPLDVLGRVDSGIPFHAWKVASLKQFRQSARVPRVNSRRAGRSFG
jgi:hypothetical protein